MVVITTPMGTQMRHQGVKIAVRPDGVLMILNAEGIEVSAFASGAWVNVTVNEDSSD